MENAFVLLRRLASGLPPDRQGTERLLERVAANSEFEVLTAALAQVGAVALIEGRVAVPGAVVAPRI